MTVSQNVFESYYPTDWIYSLQSSQHSFIVPLQDHANLNAESVRTLFAPSAGAMYVYQPSKRRRVLNRVVDKLERDALPGYEYVIAHLYDKYRRNLTISTINQTGLTLYAFLSFLQTERRTVIEKISRKDIAAYVEHEMERGLKINSVRNHLQTVYTFVGYLVDNEILPLEILHKKIRMKLPEVLPKAIPDEDLQQILSNITTVRNRAIILLLLHTGMRIGELLKVQMADIVLSENKILLPLGEKNLHGRIVYYSSAAEQALKRWLAIRKPDSDYLFYGNRGGELSYVIAWTIMKKAVQKAGLEQRGYSLHSLRHYVESEIMGSVA